MEAWHFWLIITVLFASFAIVLAIFVRKYKDKHRIQKLQKNLEDLELSFKHLTDEMQVVTNQNLSAMEEKCETMRELMAITDQKYLMVNDLLANIDKGLALIKERNLGNKPSSTVISEVEPEKLVELQNRISSEKDQLESMIADMAEEMETISRRMGYLHTRLENLEKAENEHQKVEEETGEQSQNSVPIDREALSKEVSQLVANAMKGSIDVIVRGEVSKLVTEEISKQLSFYDTEFAGIAETAIEQDIQNTTPANAGFLKPAGEKKSQEQANADIGSTVVAEPITVPDTIDIINTIELPDNVTPLFPDSSLPPDIAVGIVESETRRQNRSVLEAELMDYYNQGYTTPQIAEKMKLTRTEVNLVIHKCKSMNLAGGAN